MLTLGFPSLRKVAAPPQDRPWKSGNPQHPPPDSPRRRPVRRQRDAPGAARPAPFRSADRTLARLLATGADPDDVCSDMTLLTHAIDVEGDGSLQSGQPLTAHTTAVLLAFGADPELADPGEGAGHRVPPAVGPMSWWTVHA